MKKASSILSLIIAYLAVYFLQANFFNWFNIDGVQPNLFIVLVLIVGMFTNSKIGAVFGFVSGLYTDFLYSNSIGITAIVFALIGYSAVLLRNRFSSESKITIILMESIVTVICEIIMVRK